VCVTDICLKDIYIYIYISVVGLICNKVKTFPKQPYSAQIS
jgi:hypothetical protein